MKINRIELKRFCNLDYDFKPYCKDYNTTIKHNHLIAKDFNAVKRLGKIILSDKNTIKESVFITMDNVRYKPDYKYFKGGLLKWIAQ